MTAIRTLILPFAIAATLAACSQPADTAASAASAVAAPADAAAAAEPAVEAIQPASGTYVLDPAHTIVLASWNHMGLSEPSASFSGTEGSLTYDAADVGKSSVQVTIPLSGLEGFSQKFDEHLRSADFFEADKFPVATFKSTSVTAAGTNKLTVVGDLTIKDHVRPVTLDVTLNGAGEHAMMKKQAIGLSATGTIKRSDFGVGAYAPNVSDEVELRITTEGTIADAPAADAAAEPAQG